MAHRPHSRQRSRNSWSAFLAVLLGALAGASAFGLDAGFAGGPSIAEHGRDVRTTGKLASVRPDTVDPSLSLGSRGDRDSALAAHDIDDDPWANARPLRLPAAFDLPVSAARARDGRSRAPPRA